MRNETKTNFSSECDILFLKLLDFETFQFLGFCIAKNLVSKKVSDSVSKNLVSEKVLDSVSFRFGVFWVKSQIQKFYVLQLFHFFYDLGLGIKKIGFEEKKTLDLVSTKLGIKKVPAFDYQCRE